MTIMTVFYHLISIITTIQLCREVRRKEEERREGVGLTLNLSCMLGQDVLSWVMSSLE